MLISIKLNWLFVFVFMDYQHINIFQLNPFVFDIYLFMNEMDTCTYIKVTNRPKGPGAIYYLVLFVLLVKRAHVTIIIKFTYLLTYKLAKNRFVYLLNVMLK